MPTANDFFPSKFLKAEDLDADLAVTIKHVLIEKLQTGEEKPVVYFNETEKGLIVNKTNFSAIAKLTGKPNSDNWGGEKITLTVMDVEFKGDIVSAIRVKAATASDPDVQKYWKTIADMQMTREEGIAHLKEFKGDFAKALDGLFSDPQ